MRLLFLASVSLLLTGCVTYTPSVESPEQPTSGTSSPDLATSTGSQTDITDDSAMEPSFDEVEDTIPALDLSTLEINANGTEPFWNFAASGNNLVFNEPSQSGAMLQTTYTITMNQNGNQIIISDGSSITATLESEVCSDGMSNVIYTYSVQLQRNGDIWNGCANINQ